MFFEKIKQYKLYILLGIVISFIFFGVLISATRSDWIIKKIIPKEYNVIDNSQNLFGFTTSLYYELAEFDGKQKIYLQNSKNEVKTFYLEKDIVEYEEVLEFMSIVEPASNSIFGFLYFLSYLLFNIFMLLYAFIKYIRKKQVSTGLLVLIFTSIITINIFSIAVNSRILLVVFMFILSLSLLKYINKNVIRNIVLVGIIIASIIYICSHIDGLSVFYDLFSMNISRADSIFELIVVPIN